MLRRRIEMRVNRPPSAPLPVRLMSVDIDLSDLGADIVASRPPDRGWLESSRDLQRGMRMRETPMDSLPAELIDALLGRRT